MGRERKFNAGKEHATPYTMAQVIEYLGQLRHAGHLRALAVVYADADGRDHSLLAVQHLDQVGAASIGRGLTQLAHLLAADSLGN